MKKIVKPTQICRAMNSNSPTADGFEFRRPRFATYHGSATVLYIGLDTSSWKRCTWLRYSSTGSSLSMRKLSLLVLAFKLHWHRIFCCWKACNLSVCILLDGFRKLVFDVHVRLAPAK